MNNEIRTYMEEFTRRTHHQWQSSFDEHIFYAQKRMTPDHFALLQWIALTKVCTSRPPRYLDALDSVLSRGQFVSQEVDIEGSIDWTRDHLEYVYSSNPDRCGLYEREYMARVRAKIADHPLLQGLWHQEPNPGWFTTREYQLLRLRAGYNYALARESGIEVCPGNLFGF